jgi:hypothetical protein
MSRTHQASAEGKDEGSYFFTVHYLGGGGRISIFDGEAENPGWRNFLLA